MHGAHTNNNTKYYQSYKDVSPPPAYVTRGQELDIPTSVITLIDENQNSISPYTRIPLG